MFTRERSRDLDDEQPPGPRPTAAGCDAQLTGHVPTGAEILVA
jgi:hypothetical protein